MVPAMMLRTLSFLILLLLGIGTAAAGDRRYSVTDFDRVLVEGPYAVRLTVGRPSSAVATGSTQALEAVTIDVQGTTLRIRRNANAWGGYPGRPIEPATIMLTTRNLRSARLAGTGSIAVAGARGLQVEFSVEGSGKLSASALTADNLGLVVRGSGSIELAGTAKSLQANVQGAGSLLASALTTETATIAAATSGDILLTARRAATVTAHGLGRTEITGTAACTLSGTHAGEVRCGPARP
jgi:hypothetical protein